MVHLARLDVESFRALSAVIASENDSLDRLQALRSHGQEDRASLFLEAPGLQTSILSTQARIQELEAFFLAWTKPWFEGSRSLARGES
jgi:hypothetical protein